MTTTATATIGPKTSGSIFTNNFVTRSVSYASNKTADFTIRLLATTKYTAPGAEIANRHRTITAIFTLTLAAFLFKKLCPASLSAKIVAAKDTVVRHLPISDANKALFLSGPSRNALSDVEKAAEALVNAQSEMQKAEEARNTANLALSEAENNALTVANRQVANPQEDATKAADLRTANKTVLEKKLEYQKAGQAHTEAELSRYDAEDALTTAKTAQAGREAKAISAAAANKKG